jgi:hypothetical protein
MTTAEASAAPACALSLNLDGCDPICAEPAAVLVKAMCVHEHYSEFHACWACRSDMRKCCDDSEWTCDECRRGPEPHRCPMPMQVTVLERGGSQWDTSSVAW